MKYITFTLRKTQLHKQYNLILHDIHSATQTVMPDNEVELL